MRDLIPMVDIPAWALASGPLMLLLFTSILFWVYRGDRKRIYEHTENLPLQED